jgi:hypothetical protein
VLDAFSSDAIPTHLVTREALDLYLSRLSDEGLVVLHISNRHLRLEPVLAGLARDLGLAGLALYGEVTIPQGDAGKEGSDWVVLARSDADLAPLAGRQRTDAVAPADLLARARERGSKRTGTSDVCRLRSSLAVISGSMSNRSPRGPSERATRCASPCSRSPCR